MTSIGPIIVMPQFENQYGSISPTVQGLLVSSMIATAALSSMFSGALSDRISRTYTISLGAFVFSVGCAIACSAKALPQLFIGRSIAGLGEGIFISNITVYVMEISPTSKRGRTMTTVQLFNTLGVAAGKYTHYCDMHTSDNLTRIFYMLRKRQTRRQPFVATALGSSGGCRYRACYWHAFFAPLASLAFERWASSRRRGGHSQARAPTHRNSEGGRGFCRTCYADR